MSHLLELRDRLLRMVAAIFVLFLCLFPFANDLYLYVATPLMSRMPEGTNMIATGVATPFLTPFKLSLMASVFLSMPFILYQFWAFVAPGLYKHEQRLVMPLLISSSILFYLGMLFAYYVVFPLVFAFFIGTTPDGVAVMTDISQYLDFILTLFFAFGLAFEVPIATILLVWTGMTTPQDLGKKRPFVIVGAFVIGMLLTPPDVISQTLLALPMWVLFELGILFSRFFAPKRDEEDDAPDAEPTPTDPSPSPAPAAAAATAAGSDLQAADDKQSKDGEETHPWWDPPGAEPISADQFVGADIDGSDHKDPDRFVPMTEEEMEAELDAIEAEEEREERELQDKEQVEQKTEVEPEADEDSKPLDPTRPELDAVDMKLRGVQALRDANDDVAARALLYQVLEEGSEGQRRVARNILEQMDH